HAVAGAVFQGSAETTGAAGRATRGDAMIDLLADRVESPIGTILVIADAAGLQALDFADCEPRMLTPLYTRYGAFRLRDAPDPLGAGSRLRAYFAGDLTALDGLPVA